MTKKNKRGGWNTTKCRAKLGKQVLLGHYEWCKKESRDTNWYGEIEQQIQKNPKG